MSEEKARNFLSELLSQSECTYKVDEVLSTFRKPKDIASNKRLIAILKEITNNIPHADKHIEVFNRNIKLKDPYESFIHFLVELSNDKRRKSSTRSTGSESSSLNLRPTSSRMTRYSVQEIREKVALAATGGLSKTAQRISISDTQFPIIKAQHRPFTIWDFNDIDVKHYQTLSVLALPLNDQEITVIQELLYCLIGIQGELITIPILPQRFEQVQFKISDQLQVSLLDNIRKLLPLASHYSIVQRFIEYGSGPNRGQVLPALAAGLKGFLQEYYSSIAQLESELIKENLNLHKLIFFLQPIMKTMEVLAESLQAFGNTDIRGGSVLSILHDKITLLTGDKISQNILIHLTQLAAVPYMEILQLWILKGVIIDPHSEFLIEDNEIIGKEELPEQSYSSDYWEKRYTIERNRIPKFLNKFSDLILRTGKYLNVIRQCGKNIIPPLSLSLSYSPTDQHYETYIMAAYDFASRTLLELLMKENDLTGHLQSVKRYFLLQQGDFIEQFMDATELELSKNVDSVFPMRLENLLELTLRTSSAKNHLYNDDLKTTLLPYDLIKQMSKIYSNDKDYWTNNDKIDLTGLECFAFFYEVKWPISLVLNSFVITEYQMLFRQLFFCKHVERQLNRVWIATNHAKKFTPDTAELYRSAFTLRQRMMNAIQNIEYYMMIEVIEPSWHNFIQNMDKVPNVDEVLRVHKNFLDACMESCMLTDATLLRYITTLCRVCLNFCDFIQRAQRHFVDAELTSMLCTSETSDQSDSEYDYSSQKQRESSLAPCETFSERVKQFDLEFTSELIGLLARLNNITSEKPTSLFNNLICRINYNGFYSDHLITSNCGDDIEKKTRC